MEAAGIEPASRDRSTGASTCVVSWFDFAYRAPFLTRLPTNYPGTSVSSGRARRVDPQAIRRGLYVPSTGSGGPQGYVGYGLALTRQPKRNYLRQLKVCNRLFTWATDQPRHATHASTTRSNPVRPQEVRDATAAPDPAFYQLPTRGEAFSTRIGVDRFKTGRRGGRRCDAG